ncbi:MAG: DUF1016 family protein [Acholeplasmatales bacterium]|nr:DUF1016 family protein [Acholeplasmatales bacterium]
MTKTKEITIIEKDYLKELEKIKSTLSSNQAKAMVVVNSTMIMTYYEIGTIINQQKQWGNKFLTKLALDLKGYHGMSLANLKRMSLFAKTFSYYEISSQPVSQIPWATILSIIHKCSSHEEVMWYINYAYNNRLSRPEVEREIKKGTYLLQLSNTNNSIQINLPIENMFKDTYIIDYPGISKNNNEYEFKNKLLENIVVFLKDLGEGFALVGKEYELNIGDSIRRIDLLFYNFKVHSFVVIEVKLTKFEPENIGQLIFYVNAVDTFLKDNIDNPTIGLLLCHDADNIICKISLQGLSQPLAISKYKFIEELPEYLERKLNGI